MNNSDILFLWLNVKEFHAFNASRRGVKVFNVFKNINKPLRFFRRIHLYTKIPGFHFWFGDWKQTLNINKIVIIHASILTPPVVKYIKKNCLNTRIIVWYWNPVIKTINPEYFQKYGVEVWSFDEVDCEKHELKNNTQYYFFDKPISKSNILFDVLFVGSDKGRIGEFKIIRSTLSSDFKGYR